MPNISARISNFYKLSQIWTEDNAPGSLQTPQVLE